MEVFQRCLEATSGSTYGTGFTAIKLTALGRPQLLLQLSEVIMRTHQYFSEMTGEKGPVKNVLQKHMKPEDLQKKFEQAHILEEAPVKKFLDKITYDRDGVIHLFPWSGIIDENAQLSETFRVPDLKTGRMVRLITQLTPKEEEMFRNMIRRLDTICRERARAAALGYEDPTNPSFEATTEMFHKTLTECLRRIKDLKDKGMERRISVMVASHNEDTFAQDLDVRMMIDAEQTYFQPAISRITLEMMRKYNKDKGIVFNTYQTYLKDTFDNVTIDLEQSARQNFVFACKLVRGAYLEQVS
ncbi:hypothetical protein J437_LFUL014994 [Ladona fulva]|uniref:Proline dehydrogenase n=1 Tax=Ladona fulva TaxID=123851 RepID=A0A8K0P8M9_LADFU|nr:hypothetical protein J437_LFUL014994 [Ladona fulva]